MTINRGQLLAATYQLPAPAQQAPTPEAPFVDEVGNPESGLQQIDGVTSEYFQKWAALKGFARDVQENLGIDVRFPDPSVPESDRLHRIYLKSIADLKAQGERLKTGQQMLTADRARGAVVNQDTSKDYYDEMNVGTDIVDAKLDPIVEQANNKLEQLFFGGAIEEAKAYHTQVTKILSDRIKNDPKNSGYWQRQLDSLVVPTKAEKQFDPRPRNGYTQLQGMQIQAAGGYIKELAAVINGTADDYKLSRTEEDPDGGSVYELHAYDKNAYGGGIINGIYHVPRTGKTYAKIVSRGTDGKSTSKDQELSRKDMMGFAKELAGSNPKYAAQGAYLDVYALENGLYGPDNSVGADTPSLVRSDLSDFKKKREDELSGVENQKQQAAVKQIKDDIDSLQYRNMITPDDRKTYTKPDGGVITVVARKSKTADANGKYPVVYEIENIKELLPSKDIDTYNRFKKLNKEGLLDYLLNNKVTTTPGTKSAVTPKVNNNGRPVTDW